MRGTDDQQADMYSYLSPETRVRADHPLRIIREMADEVLKKMSQRFTKMYSRIGRPSIPSREVTAGAIAADAVLDSQRTAAGGGDRLQHPVPMVRGHEPGRASVGCHGVHQESKPSVGSGCGPHLPGRGGETGAK